MKRIIFLLSFIILTGHTVSGQVFNNVGRSIYSDVKAHRVGDVVTILIIETAKASRESKVDNSSKSDMSAGGSVTGNLTDFLPLFGASSSLSNSHNGSEGTEQKEQLTGKISATIVEETENGMFKIKGKRTVEVNGAKNLMQLEGLVRARDIRDDNTVFSYNIADANIVYRKAGFSNKIMKPGTIHKWSTWLLGTGLVLLAVVGTSK